MLDSPRTFPLTYTHTYSMQWPAQTPTPFALFSRGRKMYPIFFVYARACVLFSLYYAAGDQIEFGTWSLFRFLVGCLVQRNKENSSVFILAEIAGSTPLTLLARSDSSHHQHTQTDRQTESAKLYLSPVYPYMSGTVPLNSPLNHHVLLSSILLFYFHSRRFETRPMLVTAILLFPNSQLSVGSLIFVLCPVHMFVFFPS